MNNLTELPISQIQHLIRKNKITPVELVDEIFENISSKNKTINAYIYTSYKDAKNNAIKAEKEILQGKYRGPLHGIPISLKDLIHLRGVVTSTGSKLNFEQVANNNAEIVNNLKNNGAIIIGKENMHSLAYGSTGDVSFFGPVKNPVNTNKISGGSSSGSAASVASYMSYGSIGSDTGGSIRIPAAMCGVVGMKPTYGLVSRIGTVSLSPTLDTLGPITRTVKGNALLLEALTNSKYTSKTISTSKSDYSTFEDLAIKKKIGIPKQFYFDLIDNDIKKTFEQLVRKLASLGFEIKEINLPNHEEFNAAHSVIFATEVYESIKERIKNTPEKIEKEIRTRILEGSFIKGHEYITMNRVRHLAINTLNKVLKDVDIILTPTLGAYPCDLGKRYIHINGKRTHIRGIYSRLVKLSNLTGYPALTLPIDKNNTGFSNSVQLISRPFQEKIIYKYASEINKNY